MQAGRSVNRELVNEDGQVYGCLPVSFRHRVHCSSSAVSAPHILIGGGSKRVVINLLTVENKGLKTDMNIKT